MLKPEQLHAFLGDSISKKWRSM